MLTLGSTKRTEALADTVKWVFRSRIQWKWRSRMIVGIFFTELVIQSYSGEKWH